MCVFIRTTVNHQPSAISHQPSAINLQACPINSHLDENLVGNGGNEDGGVALGADKMTSTGHGGLALEAANELDTGLLGEGGKLGILPGAGQKVHVALARLHVLNADVDALLDNASTHGLVDDDSEGTGSNV